MPSSGTAAAMTGALPYIKEEFGLLLTPMRYKSYLWPHNPRVYSIDYQKKMAVHQVPMGYYHLQELGRSPRVLEGEGEFVGPNAYSQFGLLANVFYQPGPGLLIHPLWQVSNAYFTALRLEQEPRPDYVRYSFSFLEDSGYYSGQIQSIPASNPSPSSPNGYTQPATQPRYYRVVKGDTMWGIAAKYGIKLESLIALNPQIKNPNRIYIGDEVRVS